MAMKNDMEKGIPLDKGMAYIDIVGVCKEYQHKGIASSLIDYVFNNYEYSSYLLSVTNINNKAIACYRKKTSKKLDVKKLNILSKEVFRIFIYGLSCK